MSEMEPTVDYFEEDYLDSSEPEDDASPSSFGTIDLSTATGSEATVRYEDIEVPRKRNAFAEAPQTSQTPLRTLDGPVLPLRSWLDRQRKLSQKSPRSSRRLLDGVGSGARR